MIVLIIHYFLFVLSRLQVGGVQLLICNKVGKWATGSLMFATGSSELSFWVPDLSKLGSYVGRK